MYVLLLDYLKTKQVQEKTGKRFDPLLLFHLYKKCLAREQSDVVWHF